MAGPSYRGVRRSVALVACLVSATVLLTGPRAAGDAMREPLLMLQMNLCNSGEAGCFTGRAAAEAATVIRTHKPDLVTLNEVCQDDVDLLGEALAEVHQGDKVVWAFEAAADRRTGDPYRCIRNGQPYGNGLLAHVPASYRGHTTSGGIYPAQDVADPEQRSWLCLHAAGAFSACTTHLAYTSPTVAFAQCGYLMDTAIPAMHARAGYEPMVLGGDLNLRFGGTPDLGSCVSSDYRRVDDGGVQQIVATPDVTVHSSSLIGMAETDHPSLLVALTIAQHQDDT